MKITKGKLPKLYEKNKQTRKPLKIKKKQSKIKSFRKNKQINLSSKTLKKLKNYNKIGGKQDDETKLIPKEVEMSNLNKTPQQTIEETKNPLHKPIIPLLENSDENESNVDFANIYQEPSEEIQEKQNPMLTKNKTIPMTTKQDDSFSVTNPMITSSKLKEAQETQSQENMPISQEDATETSIDKPSTKSYKPQEIVSDNNYDRDSLSSFHTAHEGIFNPMHSDEYQTNEYPEISIDKPEQKIESEQTETAPTEHKPSVRFQMPISSDVEKSDAQLQEQQPSEPIERESTVSEITEPSVISNVPSEPPIVTEPKISEESTDDVSVSEPPSITDISSIPESDESSEPRLSTISNITDYSDSNYPISPKEITSSDNGQSNISKSVDIILDYIADKVSDKISTKLPNLMYSSEGVQNPFESIRSASNAFGSSADSSLAPSSPSLLAQFPYSTSTSGGKRKKKKRTQKFMIKNPNALTKKY